MGSGPREYDELQLRIDRDSDGSYRLLATAPQGRTARGRFAPPLTDDDLDSFVQRVGLVRKRSGASIDRMGAVKDFGSKLFESLLNEQVGNLYTSARSAAAAKGHGLRITMQLSGAPELMRLPWEFLYEKPRFLAQSEQTPFVRSLDVQSGRQAKRVEPPLRILGLASSPAGYPELDTAAERLKLEGALGHLIKDALVDLSWLENATLGDIGRRIAGPDEIHVLHYIGHGAYDERTEAGILVLETPRGRPHEVSGEDFGAMLQDEDSLRLVVLNSCEGARTSHIDPFSGVATSLLGFDIPAVIGMQFEITDTAAIAFSESLYSGLATGLPIDAAVGPARRAIVGALREAEFGTPVLYLRGGDTQLFDVARSFEQTSAIDDEPSVKSGPTGPTGNLPADDDHSSGPTGDPAADDSPTGSTGNPPPGWNSRRLALLLALVAVVGVAAAGIWTWTMMRTPSWESGPAMPVALEGAGVVSFNGDLWVAGGVSPEEGRPLLKDVNIYDPESETWRAGPTLPEAVAFASLVSAEGELYLLGGQKRAGATSDVLRLDAASDGWVAMTPLPEPREAGAAASDGSRLVFAGGVGPDHAAADDVFVREGDAWRSIGELQIAREKAAAVSDGFGTVWVIGGRDRNSGLPAFGAVDVIQVDGIGEGTPTEPVHSAAAAWVPDAGPCVFGGDTGSRVEATVRCLRGSDEIPPLPFARAGLGVATINDRVFVVGGYDSGQHGSRTLQLLRLGP